MSTLEREAEHEARLDRAYATIGRLLVEGDRLRAIITMVRQDLDIRQAEAPHAGQLLRALDQAIEDYGASLTRRT